MEKRLIFIAVALIALISGSAISTAASADSHDGAVTVRIVSSNLETEVGARSMVRVEVSNNGDTATGRLALHVDITDPSSKTSVDPEDWTPELTHPVGPIGAGQTIMETWPIVPISGGEFVMYAVVLEMDAGSISRPIAISEGLAIKVAEVRSFNPEGVTPIAVAIPGLFALALIWRGGLLGRGLRRC